MSEVGSATAAQPKADVESAENGEYGASDVPSSPVQSAPSLAKVLAVSPTIRLDDHEVIALSSISKFPNTFQIDGYG